MMISASHVRDQWRYAVSTDFHPLGSFPRGQELPCTVKSFGSETSHIPFATDTHIRADIDINSLGTLLAVPIGPTIQVYDLTTSSLVRTLTGHRENISVVRFLPGSPNRLVSSARGGSARSDSRASIAGDHGPETILWDLTDPMVQKEAIAENILDFAVDAAVRAALTQLSYASSSSPQRGTSDPSWGPSRAPIPGLPISVERRYTLSPQAEVDLRGTIKSALRMADTTTLVLAENKLRGSLSTSFQSECFSHRGDRLIYRPDTGSESKGAICIRDIVSPSSPSPSSSSRVLGSGAGPARTLELKGHTDAIMWTGFSPDDTLLASVSWDKSVRIWDAQTGEQRQCWWTTNQNWAGHWSPDGRKFLSTCGDGTVHLWNVHTGEEIWVYKMREWCRYVSWFPPGPASALALGVEEGTEEGLIAVGADSAGRVVLLTPEGPPGGVKREAIQERRLSTGRMEGDMADKKKPVERFLQVMSVRFLPVGREGSVRLGILTGIDDAVEVVDLTLGKKWRLGVRAEKHGVEPDESQRGQGRRQILPGQTSWRYSERTGQIVIVNDGGISIFDLD